MRQFAFDAFARKSHRSRRPTTTKAPSPTQVSGTYPFSMRPAGLSTMTGVSKYSTFGSAP